jgi:hypothetical protein
MRTRDREPGSSGPLKFGPKRARMAALETARRGDRPQSEPRAHTGPPDRRPAPPRHCEPAAQKLIKPMGSFEGDMAVKDLRERMALGPDLPLGPPVHKDGRSAFGMVGQLVGLVTMAAIAAGGFLRTSTPQPANSDLRSRRPVRNRTAPTMAASRRRFSSLHRIRRLVSRST